MSENPSVEFDLVDVDTGVEMETLNVGRSKTFKPIFNGAGSFSLTLPLRSDQARLVRKLSTGCLITRNGRVIWGGEATSVKKDPLASTCDVVFTGYLWELERRFVRRDQVAALTFPDPGTVGGEIIKTLIEQANLQTDTDGVVRPTRLTFGTVGDTQTRIRSYKQGDQIWRSISELLEIENGCDLVVDYLRKQISTRPPNAFQVLNGLQFGYGIDPDNLSNAVEDDDAALVFQRQSVVDSRGIVHVADDPEAIDDAGVMLESWQSIGDVDSPDVVDAYANGELVYSAYGRKQYALTPKKYGDIPRPYDDFEWGDQGYLSIDDDTADDDSALQVTEQPIRIFTATIQYDDAGNEIISDLQVVAS